MLPNVIIKNQLTIILNIINVIALLLYYATIKLTYRYNNIYIYIYIYMIIIRL